MASASKATLENIMLTGNLVGISLHENGRSVDNHVIYKPYIGKEIFLHGRDLIKEGAAFDTQGRLIIQKDAGGKIINSPFTEEAYDTVEHYYDASSLEERKAMITSNWVNVEVGYKKFIEHLDKAMPGAGIKTMYDTEMDERRKGRAEVKADPDGYADGMVNAFRKQFANVRPGMEALYISLKKSEMEEMIGPYIRGLEESTHRKITVFKGDNTIDYEALGAVAKYQAQHIDDQPIAIWKILRDPIFERICQYKHCTFEEAVNYKAEIQDTSSRELYNELQQSGFIRGRTKAYLDKLFPPALVTRYLGALEQYEFDIEQTRNLVQGAKKRGLNNLENVSPQELIEAGKRQVVEEQLQVFATDLGNPFAGKLLDQEKNVIHEIADAVPSHILEMACKDGLRLHINVGDQTTTQNANHLSSGDLFTAGGYRADKCFAHPFIELSPDNFENISDALQDVGGDRKSLGQLARHEYRHYWADHEGYNDNADLPAAVNADRAHFRNIQQALESMPPNIQQKELLDGIAAALGCSDTADKDERISKVIKIVEILSQPWLAESSTKGKDIGKPGYANIEQIGEVFPRLDEVVMMYGDEVAHALFPNTHALMQRLDNEVEHAGEDHARRQGLG